MKRFNEESGPFFLVIGLGLIGLGVYLQVAKHDLGAAVALFVFGAFWLSPALWFMVKPTRPGQRVNARLEAQAEARAESERAPHFRKRALLPLALILALGCFWIVGIWVEIPWWGMLHDRLRVKVFWTAFSVLIVGILVWSFVTHERQRSRHAKWRSDVASWRSEVERLDRANPGAEVVPQSVKTRGFVISVGYHGVPRKDLDSVLSEGLLRDRTESYGCQQGGHIAIAGTPEIAANFGEVILAVILDDLEGMSLWYGGEARVHGDIPPSRLSVYQHDVSPGWKGYIDPAKTPLGNHPACCYPWRLEGFDFDDYRET